MRLIAIALVVLTGALLIGIDAWPEARASHADELGNFCVAFGLLALGIEMYVIPIVKWKLGRD